MGWKMVRDRQRTWCEENAVSGSWRYAGRQEAIRALARKLAEESLDFGENFDPAELDDVADVLQELRILIAPPGSQAARDARAAHDAKVALHGMFHDHLMWTPLPGEEGS